MVKYLPDIFKLIKYDIFHENFNRKSFSKQISIKSNGIYYAISVENWEIEKQEHMGSLKWLLGCYLGLYQVVSKQKRLILYALLHKFIS